MKRALKNKNFKKSLEIFHKSRLIFFDKGNTPNFNIKEAAKLADALSGADQEEVNALNEELTSIRDSQKFSIKNGLKKAKRVVKAPIEVAGNLASKGINKVREVPKKLRYNPLVRTIVNKSRAVKSRVKGVINKFH